MSPLSWGEGGGQNRIDPNFQLKNAPGQHICSADIINILRLYSSDGDDEDDHTLFALKTKLGWATVN